MAFKKAISNDARKKGSSSGQKGKKSRGAAAEGKKTSSSGTTKVASRNSRNLVGGKRGQKRSKGDEKDEETETVEVPRTSAKKRLQERKHVGFSSDDDDDGVAMLEDGDDNLSELGDEWSEEENEKNQDAEENPFVRARRDGTKLSYPVLRLRFLPPEFEEPQLFKFLNQFGATVLNCFCVRSKRTLQSLGIAYVQFDNPSVLETVREECDGMLLGGRMVRAKIMQLHRAMPSKEAVAKRRKQGRIYRDKGQPLRRFVSPSKKNDIAALIKATRSETRNNHLLAQLGIDFRSTAFADQLACVPKESLKGKKASMVSNLLKLAQWTGEKRSQTSEGGEEKNSQDLPLSAKKFHRAMGGKLRKSRGGRRARSKSQTAKKAAPKEKVEKKETVAPKNAPLEPKAKKQAKKSITSSPKKQLLQSPSKAIVFREK